MSPPEPVTVKVPSLALALPVAATAPMSAVTHGDGSGADGVALA
jgi:hypothetical protein